METLLYLAETYFHQDWDINAPTPLGVVEQFRSREAAETVAGLRADLEQLLSNPTDESALRETWLRKGRADWNPTTDGWDSFRSWLEAVLRVVSD